MRVVVAFQNECLEIEVPEDRLIARWHGPAGSAPSESGHLVRDALENPRDFPPLRQAVVPGDRVVIALDADIPLARLVLEAIVRVLQEAGVDASTTTVVARPGVGPGLAENLPSGISLTHHDPDDRNQHAYLANTAKGRRVYLNRHLIDADFVLPVGRIGYDPVFGYRGPWSVIFPGLSDQATLKSFRALQSAQRPDRERPRPALAESTEVSWLLGSQFQLGLVAGFSGLAGAVAGAEAVVRDRGAHALDRAWSFEAESRAELVVVGIGRPGTTTRIEDLAEGLATATQLVQRGGKIVALSRADGDIGPALRRLIGAGDPRGGLAALRGHEADHDYTSAQQLARALAWADVYLLSALSQEDVEDLSMIVLDRPEEARRLVAMCGACVFISQAELTRARALGEEE